MGPDNAMTRGSFYGTRGRENEGIRAVREGVREQQDELTASLSVLARCMFVCMELVLCCVVLCWLVGVGCVVLVVLCWLCWAGDHALKTLFKKKIGKNCPINPNSRARMHDNVEPTL